MCTREQVNFVMRSRNRLSTHICHPFSPMLNVSAPHVVFHPPDCYHHAPVFPLQPAVLSHDLPISPSTPPSHPRIRLHRTRFRCYSIALHLDWGHVTDEVRGGVVSRTLRSDSVQRVDVAPPPRATGVSRPLLRGRGRQRIELRTYRSWDGHSGRDTVARWWCEQRLSAPSWSCVDADFAIDNVCYCML